MRYLSREELPRLLKACKESHSKDLYLIVLIALTTGARKSEILGLKGIDVDFDNGSLSLIGTKNGENSSLAMSEEVMQLLKERPLQSDQLLFPSTTNPLKPYEFRSAWEKALKYADIKCFTFHSLRHTAASYLAMDGASTREVAELLNHKTMQMSKRYSHLSHQHKRKLTGYIEKRINDAIK